MFRGDDLHATLLYLLGLDHTRLNHHNAGRRFRLTEGIEIEAMVPEGLRDTYNGGRLFSFSSRSG